MNTGQTALKYGAALIGTYLVVFYASGSSKFLTAATAFVTGETKSLQGR
jgi:hypothetical protein